MADATQKVNGISPPDPQRGIGDNGGPRLQKFTAKQKVERIKEVLDMDITAAQKCVGVAVICEADTDWITPELSTADLQRYASVKDRETVYRAVEKLKAGDVVNPVREKGRPNRYVVLPSIDAALDDIDAHPTSRVEPDGVVGAIPVGLNPTTPVRSDPTGPAEPDPTGRVEPDTPSSRARADITTRATKESPTGIVIPEASKLASAEPAEGEVLAGLNGAADVMLSDILGWQNCGDKRSARQWLSTTLHTFGQAVTAQSYHKLKTDIADGLIVSRPLQTWAKIAQRMKAEPASDAKPAKGISRLKEKFLRAGG
jgi:hypothetical protein